MGADLHNGKARIGWNPSVIATVRMVQLRERRRNVNPLLGGKTEEKK